MVLFCFFYVTYLFGEYLVKRQQDIRTEITETLWNVDKNQSIIQLKDKYLKAKTESESQIKDVVEYLLSEQDSALAAANLQKTLDVFAKESNMEIQNKKARNPSDFDIFREISVELNLKGTMRQLHEFLFKIEFKVPKLLAIRRLEIRVDNYRDPREVFTKIVVAGFTLKQQDKR
jgi:hypothetical protein